MRYLDLFSGIGGFALGIQQAGVKIDKHYFSEVDKYATQIYKRHFPNAIELGDIKTIKPETLGKIDLITFGFPCQDLSIAGKRAGLGGTRSGLFFEAMRIINELRPSVFIFENVKGLLTSNEGKDFEIVLREIADIGIYECEWQLVNTSWVLPQNRERIYFIGHLGEGSGQKVFPIGAFQEGTDESAEKKTQAEFAPTIDSRIGNYVHWGTYIKMINLHQKRTGEYEDGEKDNHEPSFTLDSSSGRDLCIAEEDTMRRITPIECERFQGFPNDWTKGLSDARRYIALGNAVSVPIVKMIIERLYKCSQP